MSAPLLHPDLKVDIAPLPDLAQLQSQWLELESRADASYFRSWAWIGPWLRLICPARIARLLTVESAGQRVGLGILTERRRFFGLGPLHLRLHETGERALDDITIEYNGLLCTAGLEREVLAATVAHLARNDRRWLTLHLPGLDAGQVPADGFGHAQLLERRLAHPTQRIDLEALRGANGDYIDSLRSARTRANLRRTARRLAADHGPVVLRHAQDESERQAYFQGLVALHQAHWTTARRRKGAFADPRILRFHEALMAEAGAGHGPQLFRIEAGDRVIGYNYTLAWRGVMYGYQLGIDYARHGHCGSPGLLALALTAQHALQQGYSRYELMAGNNRYKHALGMDVGSLLWLSLDRRNWQSRLRTAWWALHRSDRS